MYGVSESIKICGISSAVPERVVDNGQLIDFLESKRMKRQILLTGIERRHLCVKGQAASDLACVAAEKLLDYLNWDREEIRVLVFVTQSPDLAAPSTAMIIQKRLGIGKSCLAFDVNLGCSGYASGLVIISALLENIGGKGLLLVGDGSYYEMPDKVDTNSLLFGDGAGATALEAQGGKGLVYSQYTDGNRYQLLMRPLFGPTRMDGNAILLFSLGEVTKGIMETKEHFSIQEEEVDYYILHQAQKMILDGIGNECQIESKKILVSYDEFGNTSTATLPVTICYNADEIKKKKQAKLFMSGFGVGLAWCNVCVEIDTDGILPLIYTNQCYHEEGIES